MKKTALMLAAALCLTMTACSNEFAQQEYDSAEKIAQSGDKYAKSVSVMTWNDCELSFSAGSFDGRETMWSEIVIDEGTAEISVSLSLEEGMAKLVHIDPDDNITELIESTYGKDICRTITMPVGENRIKLVGYGCKELELKMVLDY